MLKLKSGTKAGSSARVSARELFFVLLFIERNKKEVNKEGRTMEIKING